MVIVAYIYCLAVLLMDGSVTVKSVHSWGPFKDPWSSHNPTASTGTTIFKRLYYTIIVFSIVLYMPLKSLTQYGYILL